MKRIIVTILAIAYLGTSTGAMISMHFCMGKLANWSFGNDETKTCGKCGMEKKSNHGCCQDEHKFFKSSSDQKITESAFKQVQSLAAVLPAPFFELTDVVLPRITEENPTGHAPPLHHGVSIYIFTCDYRI
jgi:hypothetical protein